MLYGLKQENDCIITLLQYKDTDWTEFTIQETLLYPGWADNYNNFMVPSFTIVDFNRDGNEDLLFYVDTNVHGNIATIIFLNDPKQKKLVKLDNIAEGSDIWDAPEYNPKTKIITCNRMGGNSGLSFTSTYKLNGLQVIPLQKKDKDYTNFNGETGAGTETNQYTGKNGKWVKKK